MSRVLVVLDDDGAIDGLREMLAPHVDVILPRASVVRVIARPIVPFPVLTPMIQADRDEPWRRQGKRKGARTR